MNDLIVEKLKHIPKSYHRMYLRAMKGKSRLAAMKAECLECVCWVRAEIAKCGIPTCPLYLFSHPGAKSLVAEGGLGTSEPKKVSQALQDGLKRWRASKSP